MSSSWERRRDFQSRVDFAKKCIEALLNLHMATSTCLLFCVIILFVPHRLSLTWLTSIDLPIDESIRKHRRKERIWIDRVEDSDKSADVEGSFRGTGRLDRNFIAKCSVNNWSESKWLGGAYNNICTAREMTLTLIDFSVSPEQPKTIHKSAHHERRKAWGGKCPFKCLRLQNPLHHPRSPPGSSWRDRRHVSRGIWSGG